MKVFIGDKDKLFKYDLPTSGTSFTISYRPLDFHEDILILFEYKDSSWYLNSSGSLNVIQNNTIVPTVKITNYSNYTLKYVANNISLVLYFIPDKEEYTKVNTIPMVSVGNTPQSNINYNITTNQMEYLTITSSNNLYSMKTCEGLPIYLNNELTKGSTLHIGDIIFISGFKLIFMGTFLLVNNPNNTIKVVGMTLYQDNNIPNNKYSETTEEEKYVDLYSDKDYFAHTPRIREVIEEEEVTIDQPPQVGEPQKLPWYLTFGPSITIFISMFIYIFNISNRLSAGSTLTAILPTILMCISMIIASIIIPFLANRYTKKSGKYNREKALNKYNEYLTAVEKKLVEIEHKQRSILDNNALSIKRMLTTINNKDLNFWNRRITDDDFLKLRLGTGTVPVKVKVKAPEAHFSVEQDELLHKVLNLSKAHLSLEDAPISYSFTDNKITSMILNMQDPYKYINDLMIQVIGLHSPIDLKIAVFTNKANESKWDFVKYLPHNWSNDKTIRYFATDINEAKDVSNSLSEKLNERVSNDKEADEKAEGDATYQEQYKNYNTYYLIINDDYEIGKNIPIIANLQKYDKNYGFSMIVFGKSLKKLPEKCPSFIQIDSKHGAVISHLIQSDSQTKFDVEATELYDIKAYSRLVSNVPVQVDEVDSVLPKSINFLEMFGVSRIEQLNILNRWKTNNPVNSLKAQVGVHASGDPFYLDLHEKAHGPHGLIAGSTGSGKSEFIISYVLSMALNYDPREVQFLLIDYKGGGLAGAFENKETGFRIPHVIGTITNLDTNEINRALASVTSELERRQRIFNQAKDETGESTIDIYKYQKLYREGAVKEPLAHLFIISDEFAELKKQQPDFMDELIQTARIGRSLGVHLVLATQKPSGVVNDQIWSNSKFKICLRVQDRGDSQEVLKRPDAASIKETGRFYLQVGYDELFDIGQAGWAGARYHPTDKIIRNIDDSIEIVSNTGESKRSLKEIVKIDTTEDIGDELTNLVKYICEEGKNINTKTLWLNPLSPVIYIDNLKKKYNYQPTPYLINPVIGEYDSPENQLQGILNLNLSENGNTLIYGAPGSGKENLLSTIIWSTAVEHVPQEVSMYIVDFGSGLLKMFSKLPHVGDIASIDEPDKIVDTFKMLEEESQKRKELFADYGGSYLEYNKNNEKKLPLIITILNSYEVFQETMPRFFEAPNTLFRDGAKYGIIFIITVIQTNVIRSRVAQNFNNIITLQLADDYDYRELVHAPRGLTPAKYFGRGLIGINKKAFEFQTALIVERSHINNVVRDTCPKLIEAYKGFKAPPIPTVPKVVTCDILTKELDGLAKVPVGYDINKKAPITYDFNKNKFNIVAAPFMDDDKVFFVFALIKMISSIEKVIVFDLANAYSLNIPNVVCYKNDFDNKAGELYKVLSTDTSTRYTIIILGAGDINTKAAGKYLKAIFALKSDNFHVILIDHINSLKNIELDEWYQDNVDNTEGIWLGPEIASQLLISVNDISMDDRRINFLQMGFVIKDSKHYTMKHMLLMENTDEK